MARSFLEIASGYGYGHQNKGQNLMRALVSNGTGSSDVLTVAELPIPEPGVGEVRIRVAAAPVNPVDIASRSGALGTGGPFSGTFRLGWDVAGRVDAVGAAVEGYAVGDPVIGLSFWFDAYNGMQAEYAVLPVSAIAPAPRGLSLIQASTLPLNASTALQAVELMGLEPGRTIGIIGAAGAVGGYAAQLARSKGLKVIGIGSEADREFIGGLGATFIDREGDVVAAVRDETGSLLDGVLDTAIIGPAALDLVRDGGTLVTLVGAAAPDPVRDIDVRAIAVEVDADRLGRLAELAGRGELTTRVSTTFPLTAAHCAHDYSQKRGLRGRTVLVP